MLLGPWRTELALLKPHTQGWLNDLNMLLSCFREKIPVSDTKMSTLFDRLQIDLEELKREQRKFKEGLDAVMQSLEKLTLEDNEKITEFAQECIEVLIQAPDCKMLFKKFAQG